MPLDFKTPPRRAPRRPLRALLVGLGLTLASWAGFATSAGAEVITKAELETLIWAEDIDAVEAALADAHKAYQDGAVDADYNRRLNELFGTASPTTARFVERWRARYPDSPFGHTAQAWIYHKVGWTLLGENPGIWTYYRAEEAFDAMMYKAAGHAEAAWDRMPDLLPASDAMIYMAAMGYSVFPFDGLLTTVMDRQPNEGTLMRSLMAADPTWGGDWALGEDLCRTQAPKIAEWGEEAVPICLLWINARYYGARPRDAYLAALAQSDAPALKVLRYHAVKDLEVRDPDWIAEAQAQFDDPTYRDLSEATDFDQSFTMFTPGAPMATSRVARRARAWANAQIARDPYDLEALDILTNEMGFRRHVDGTVYPEVDRRVRENPRYASYIARLLTMQPWDSFLWSRLEATVQDRSSRDGFAARMQYRANVIAFSNHRPNTLATLITNLLLENANFDRMADNSPDPATRDFARTMDRDALINCPLVRAARLLEAMCEAVPNVQGCASKLHDPQTLQRQLGALSDRGVCTTEFNAPLEAIVFEGEEVDLRGLDGI